MYKPMRNPDIKNARNPERDLLFILILPILLPTIAAIESEIVRYNNAVIAIVFSYNRTVKKPPNKT